MITYVMIVFLVDFGKGIFQFLSTMLMTTVHFTCRNRPTKLKYLSKAAEYTSFQKKAETLHQSFSKLALRSRIIK